MCTQNQRQNTKLETIRTYYHTRIQARNKHIHKPESMEKSSHTNNTEELILTCIN